MGNEKFKICCDKKEEALANALKDIIIKNVTSCCEVTICATPDDLINKTWDHWQTYFDNTKYIFILCSPYSIRQQGVNFISGVATIHAKVVNDSKILNP